MRLSSNIFLFLFGTLALLSCNDEAGKSFQGGKNESKPTAKEEENSNGLTPKEGAPSKILGFSGGVKIALRSGLVLCKDGRIEMDILSNFTFEMKGVSGLKCVSANVDMNEILPPIINMVAKSMGTRKITVDQNVILADGLPSFKGMKFDPKGPLFFVPTIGDEAAKSQGFKKVYDVNAIFNENPMGIKNVKGQSTVAVLDVNKPYSAPDGKVFDKTVHWNITYDWEEPGVVPFFRVMDVTWSTAPIDLLNIGIEIVINPKNVPLYTVALQSELLKSVQGLMGMVDLDVDVGLVVSITR